MNDLWGKGWVMDQLTHLDGEWIFLDDLRMECLGRA